MLREGRNLAIGQGDIGDREAGEVVDELTRIIRRLGQVDPLRLVAQQCHHADLDHGDIGAAAREHGALNGVEIGIVGLWNALDVDRDIGIGRVESGQQRLERAIVVGPGQHVDRAGNRCVWRVLGQGGQADSARERHGSEPLENGLHSKSSICIGVI